MCWASHSHTWAYPSSSLSNPHSLTPQSEQSKSCWHGSLVWWDNLPLFGLVTFWRRALTVLPGGSDWQKKIQLLGVFGHSHLFFFLMSLTFWSNRFSQRQTGPPPPKKHTHNRARGFLIKLQAFLMSNQVLQAVMQPCNSRPLIQMNITERGWSLPLVSLSLNGIDSKVDRCCTLQITLLLYSWSTRLRMSVKQWAVIKRLRALESRDLDIFRYRNALNEKRGCCQVRRKVSRLDFASLGSFDAQLWLAELKKLLRLIFVFLFGCGALTHKSTCPETKEGLVFQMQMILYDKHVWCCVSPPTLPVVWCQISGAELYF